MSNHRYVIQGTPQFIRRYENRNRHVFDAYKDARMYFMVALENIHDQLPLLQGPLHLDISFYFKIPEIHPTCQKQLENKFFTNRPKTTKLIEFVEEVALGILFDKEFNIVSVNAQKKYDYSPRTEFTIVELKNDKEDKNK